MTLSTSPTISGSSAEVGSSKSMISGSIASALAIATLCFCPPERDAGYFSALSASPTVSSSLRAFSSAAAFSIPLTLIGARVRLSSTVMCGNRLNPWNTMPSFSRISSISTSESLIFFPSRKTSPPLGSSNRFRQRRNVLLPEPEGPITQTTSRSLIVSLIPLRT